MATAKEWLLGYTTLTGLNTAANHFKSIVDSTAQVGIKKEYVIIELTKFGLVDLVDINADVTQGTLTGNVTDITANASGEVVTIVGGL